MANGKSRAVASGAQGTLTLSEKRAAAGRAGAVARWGKHSLAADATTGGRTDTPPKGPSSGLYGDTGSDGRDAGQVVTPSVPTFGVPQPDTGNALIDVVEAQDTTGLPKNALDTLGVRGIANWSGIQLPEPNVKLQLILAYGTPGNQVWGEWEKLARTNPAATAALEMVCSHIRDARVEVETNEDNPDSELAQKQSDFLEDNIRNWLEPLWPETMHDTTWGMLVFGHRISEVVHGLRLDKRVPGGKAYYVKKLVDRLPSTVLPNGWVEKNDELAVIKQVGQRNGQWYSEVDLPANKVLLFTWNRTANNYQGFSALRPVWYLGLIYTELLKILAIGHQRETLGTPIIEVDKDARLTDDQWKRLQKLAQNMTYHENAGAALPAGVKMNWVYSGATRGKSHLLATIQEIKLTIFEIFMTQQAALGTGGTGSRAVGTVHQQQKTAFVQGVLANVESVLNGVGDRPYTGLVGKILRPNWGVVEFPPRIKLTLQQAELSPTDFTQAVQFATGSGALTITLDDENTVREKLGFAPIDDAKRDEERAKKSALTPPAVGAGPAAGQQAVPDKNGGPPAGTPAAGAPPVSGGQPPPFAKAGERILFGDTVLDVVQTKGRPPAVDKDVAHKEVAVLQSRIAAAHRSLGGASLAVILEGRDAAGKTGTVERIAKDMDESRVQLEHTAFPLYPEQEMVQRDIDWYAAAMPGPGRVTIFDRSYYSTVFGIKTNAPDAMDWEKWYRDINAFEKKLVSGGTRLLKFYCEISKLEQRKRLLDRKNDPEKRWKLKPSDWRAHWQFDLYTPVIEECIVNTDTEMAPWTLVDMEDKQRGRLRIMETVCNALEDEARKPASTKIRFRHSTKLAEWTPSRPLRPEERALALKDMSDYLDSAPQAFEDGAKPLVVEMLVAALPNIRAAKGDPALVAQLQLDSSKLRDFVRKFIGSVASEGYRQVSVERKGGPARAGKASMTKLASEEEEDPQQATTAFEEAQADALVKRIRNRVQSALEREAIDVDRTGADDDEIVSEVTADVLDSATLQSDGRSVLTKAWNVGREQFARERGDEVSAVTLSAILDRNTCTYCMEHDGDDADFGSQEHDAMVPPLRECEGGDACRCLLVYTFEPDTSDTTDELT